MEEPWKKTVIKPKTGWFDLDIKELVRYRDLIWMFVKRNFSVQYKQTILGPLWFVINPLLTTVMFTFVFGMVAGISTDGVPQFLFYMSGNTFWSYFATCLTSTSNTFTNNAGLFGKIYFPRLTVPVSTVIFSGISFLIQLGMLTCFTIYYAVSGADIAVHRELQIGDTDITDVAILHYAGTRKPWDPMTACPIARYYWKEQILMRNYADVIKFCVSLPKAVGVRAYRRVVRKLEAVH